MADGPFDPETGELIPKPPEREDLVALCGALNGRGPAKWSSGALPSSWPGCLAPRATSIS